MKRLRSSDDLDSYGEKSVSKDWGRREEDPNLHRSSSHRGFYYKSEGGRKGLSSSSSRYDRSDDERDSLRPVKKRTDYDAENYERRKGYDRYSYGNERGILSSSPRGGYSSDRIHRSENFSATRREIPKGFRSERDRPRPEGSVSSWRRISAAKDSEEVSKSSGEFVKATKTESDDVVKSKSPTGLRDAKSPAWSKDSESEQSRSVEIKKAEELPVNSSGQSSEMEEGELQPDPHPSSATETAVENESETPAELNSSMKEAGNEHRFQGKELEGVKNSLIAEKGGSTEVESEDRHSENAHRALKEVPDLPDDQSASMGTSAIGDRTVKEIDGSDKGEKNQEESSWYKQEVKNMVSEKSPPLRFPGETKIIHIEAKEDVSKTHHVDKGFAKETGAGKTILSASQEESIHVVKDKGKRVNGSPYAVTNLTEDAFRFESESKGISPSKDFDMEQPNARGLDLFLSGPVKKPDKTDHSSTSKSKDEKLGLEPLDLSLSLPNVLLPIGAKNAVEPPGSPSQARSFQSYDSTFRTNSDGFTMSMSFSGSQHFTHNPSCSLTHNSVDYEQSVKSRPLFQGVDWQALAANEQKNSELPASQPAILSNGVGFHRQSQSSQGNSTGQPLAKHLNILEGKSITPVLLDQQRSFSRQLSGTQSRYTNGARSPPRSVGSFDNGSNYSREKKHVTREKDDSSYRFNHADGKEQALALGADFIESIITTMVSEPLHVTSRRFSEMRGQHLISLKEYVNDIISNTGKQWQLTALQKALQKRTDATFEILVKLHRTQLEILVSLKTGLQDFLQQKYDVSSSELAEIYLNLRCKNVACRNLLPVDDCDCKICSQKNGFCRECMCLVCSKFDSASNTCSWVGCDVCLHWCHADCGLRESFIRNGCSASATQGTVEMQFHCVACNHPSEMFGFVKEVFLNFAKDWTAEALSKELEYVRRIFFTSEDVRGKRLHEIAIQMLTKLSIKVDLQEVKNQIMHFLTEAEAVKSANVAIASRKELETTNREANNRIVGSSYGPVWSKLGSEKHPQLEKSSGLQSNFEFHRNDKPIMGLDLQPSLAKEPVFDELESIIKVKQAEAKMFQAKADDARRESDALKRIAVTKSERVEEEFGSRISKLRLAEAEEMRKQKWDELQTLERSYHDYFNMKMRMESDIKDLLLKMEATRRNLSM